MAQFSSERDCLQFLLLGKERVERVSNISTFQSPTSGLAFLPTYSTDGTSIGWRPEGSWEQWKWWVACGSWHGFAWLGEDPQLEASHLWGRGVKSASNVLAFLRTAWGDWFLFNFIPHLQQETGREVEFASSSLDFCRAAWGIDFSLVWLEVRTRSCLVATENPGEWGGLLL